MMMNLYEKFCAYTNLPIRIDWVAEQVCEECNIDDLQYISVDVDPDYLLGMHRMFISDQGEDKGKKVLQIFYNSHLNADHNGALKRFVVCKELLHAYDTDKYTAKSIEAVTKLIDGIVVPPSAGMDSSLLSDHNGMLYALIVLLPRDALDTLIPAHESNYLSVEDVARLADIPEHYARLGLSTLWKDLVEKI